MTYEYQEFKEVDIYQRGWPLLPYFAPLHRPVTYREIVDAREISVNPPEEIV